MAGLPPDHRAADAPARDPAALTYTWSVEKGPGAVIFEGSAAESSRKVTFYKAGTYRLRVTVSDGIDFATDTVDVKVKR